MKKKRATVKKIITIEEELFYNSKMVATEEGRVLSKWIVSLMRKAVDHHKAFGG